MDFSYKKNNNKSLFDTLENMDLLNVKDTQNYIPIYQKFFTLNDSNYNNINLNQKLKITNINKKHSENKYIAKVENDKGDSSLKEVFFKIIPLLDPIKYMTSKYDVSDTNLLNLPSFIDNSKGVEKVHDPNNSAYVDSFFTYLTSQMLHIHKFIHGIDFYGSYLATKRDILINIADDLDYLHESKAFHQNRGVIYEIENNFHSELIDYDTRNYKRPLKLSEKLDTMVLELSDIGDLSNLNEIFASKEKENNKLLDVEELKLLYDSPIESKTKSKDNVSSECSSRSSNTSMNSIRDDKDKDDDNKDDETKDDKNKIDMNNETESEIETISTASEDEIFVKFKEFPVQLVALENCHKTLDSLITTEELSDNEMGSIVVQVLMMLITYQKVFGLTHNDLHTNNIMYVQTDKQYIYYKYDNTHYKVPTYGKIFKIIDFGRAIYKFRGNVICSDSFSSNGDAATQYNFEPYFDGNKPRIEPNFSFDLCRLGCAMHDMLKCDDEDDLKSPIVDIILNWCKDDKGRNILYKKNGEERYPEFKLYKMISRTVRKHIPSDVLKNDYFDRYKVSKKKIKQQKILNIDILESYQ